MHGMIFKPYVPAAYGKTPTTPAEVLEAAACLLEEEGRWTQQHWYTHHDPAHDEYVDNPYCNGWSVCADGALQCVTSGAYRNSEWDQWFVSGVMRQFDDTEDGRTQFQLYMCARDQLDDYLLHKHGYRYPATRFNDAFDTTREMVVSAMRDAATFRHEAA